MITFKCKMCGGDLEFEQGATVVECPYCGSRQTLPKLDNDKRANMYDRANHFRRQNEYDKAMAIYEQILQEDRTDAEAYWSLVLCRYGIEYVEDPASHKRMPTVNRVQYTSVLADEDYKSALQYADAGQRTVYEGEAKAIDEIQKGILEISKQEKPFDVFICYKETDANGRRTPDSVLANDLYHQLTKEGFKVFFSRITLEDKIGTAYEPYIFAALNSAKVMVVLGTKPEYFNAVWVKNEWSRYLALIRAGADKVLVPAYRDMDPYDLPDEFSHLQAQDMGKLGFMQDLIRGIKKITAGEQQEGITTNNSAPGVSSLHKRAVLFLEDGNWDAAQEYLDRILDIDPEFAPAYIGKVQVALHVRQEKELANQEKPFSDNADYQKALRFASAQQKAIYSEYINTIENRIEMAKREKAYQSAINSEKIAATSPLGARENNYIIAAKQYEQAGDYKDAIHRAEVCREKASFVKEEYNKQQEEKRKKEEQERIEQQRRIEEVQRAEQEQARRENLERERRKKHTRKICLVLMAIVLLCGGVAAAYQYLYLPHQQYLKADADLKAGRLQAAMDGFLALGNYSDSSTRVQEVWYVAGKANLESGDLTTAKKYLQQSNKYKDATALINQIDTYWEAEKADEQGDYITALKKYKALGSFVDASARLETSMGKLQKYTDTLFEKHDYQQYYDIVSAISDFPGAQEVIDKIHETYNLGLSFIEQKNYDSAIVVFSGLYNYSDCEERVLSCKYMKASEQLEKGEYDLATKSFMEIADYQDSNLKAKESQYKKAEALLSKGDLDGAIVAFESVSEYKDSKDRALSVRHEKAMNLWKNGKHLEAAAIFKSLGNYKTAAEDMKAVCLEAADIALQQKDYVAALTAYQYLPQTDEIKEMEYKLAQNCYDMGNYADATAAYETLGQYELSASRLPVARYAWADQLFKEGEYAKAAEQFKLLGSMTDSADRAKKSTYQLAKQYLQANQYDEARKTFASIKGYNDADTQVKECDYQKASDLMNAGKNAEAQKLFESLSTYRDSANKAKECIYRQAEELFIKKEYANARTLYSSIDYSDSKSKEKECSYLQATSLYDQGKYSDAEKLFQSIKDYKESATKLKDCRLQQGKSLFDKGEYEKALTFFEVLDYQNSADLTTQCYYQLGHVAQVKGDTDNAVRQYAYALDLPETQQALFGIAKDYAAINEIEKTIQTLWLIRGQENAKKMLLEIANLKVKSGDIVTAVIAWCALEDSALQNISYEINKIDSDIFMQALKSYALLPTNLLFQEFIRRGYAINALNGDQYMTAISVLDGIEDYRDTEALLNEARYKEGQALLSSKKIDKAIEIFTGLREYKDAEKYLKEANYEKGLMLFDAHEFESAKEAFSSAGDYKDATDKLEITNKEITYIKALNYFKNEDWKNAQSVFAQIRGYKDSDEKYNKAAHEIKLIPYKKIGGSISFGKYEQDNNTKNGKEPIEWIIAEVEGNKVMIVSRYALDCQPFNKSVVNNINWKDSSLRNWLNNTFYNAAFSDNEKNAIPLSTVKVSPPYNKKSEADITTKDKIFIPSYDVSPNCKPTQYAQDKGIRCTSYGYCAYWDIQRSKHEERGLVQYFTYDFHKTYYGDTAANENDIGVRVALWLDLNSSYFQ